MKNLVFFPKISIFIYVSGPMTLLIDFYTLSDLWDIDGHFHGQSESLLKYEIEDVYRGPEAMKVKI